MTKSRFWHTLTPLLVLVQYNKNQSLSGCTVTDRMSFNEALAFAEEAHKGQEYKRPEGREPYINHVLRVANRVSQRAKIAAVLHDCLEDAGRLPEQLDEVNRRAVEFLTRDKVSLSYETYIKRIAEAPSLAGKIAREVKIADLRENLMQIRSGHMEHLRSRYEAALEILCAIPY